MQTIIETTVITYWIAGDGESIAHYGCAQLGQTVSTGQPALYTTESRAQWIAQLVRLGVPIDPQTGEPPASPAV